MAQSVRTETSTTALVDWVLISKKMTKITIGAIQAGVPLSKEEQQRINDKSIDEAMLQNIKERTLVKYEKLIVQAAKQGVQILGLPEIFAGPFFAAVPNDTSWRRFAEKESGNTVARMQKMAKKHKIVIIVPFYEVDNEKYYNTCAVIDADGKVLGKYRKLHVPENDGFNEQDYFEKGNLGLPVFETKYGKIGTYTCFDRHFETGFQVLKEQGAKIVFIASATVASTSEYIWEPEARIRAYDNKFFVVAINRVGKEGIGDLKDTYFYGSTVIVSPRGEVLAKGSRDKEEVICMEVDIDKDIEFATARYPKQKHLLTREEYYR